MKKSISQSLFAGLSGTVSDVAQGALRTFGVDGGADVLELVSELLPDGKPAAEPPPTGLPVGSALPPAEHERVVEESEPRPIARPDTGALIRLAELHQQGLLTREEFDAAKADLFGSTRDA
ncbi:MAG: SHOCT domain-containing protein [Microbacteriaceae bacterium]